MGLINKIASALQGGKTTGGTHEDRGIYLYVKLDKSGEIVRLRLDPQHDLAPDYKKGTYFSNKTIIGPRSIEKAEAVFFFDEKKTFESADIAGGTLSNKEAYLLQQDTDT